MDDLAHLQNTAATFDEVLNYGRPAHPLNFPEPQFSAVTRVNASVHNPITNETGEIEYFLRRSFVEETSSISFYLVLIFLL